MEYSKGESEEVVEWKLNHEAALIQHNRHAATSNVLLESVFSFGLEAIRTTAILNGGAVIAVFAFLGSLYGKDPANFQLVRALLPAAFTFAVGALLAGLASGFAYFAQMLYSVAHDDAVLMWKYPYCENKPSQDGRLRFGIFWHTLCVCTVAASYGCIILGLVEAWAALNP
ncbi:hypothetical protein [Sinorhizobium medicae]|uniref:hypothetical protein n=1 Tax=Sinorhizobium medicae TaxID=110321 RepID=UPI001296B721|nr:hypothetical protein [Sinorhizobium medicae]MDX1004620.1 hypothetical protein [Sinorhizobium medicae]MDX1045486.1 hypothetical protein [Sinorhizobium medicae]MQX77523.1 hypothetical protein [Sinorhizobium medicae]